MIISSCKKQEIITRENIENEDKFDDIVVSYGSDKKINFIYTKFSDSIDLIGKEIIYLNTNGSLNLEKSNCLQIKDNDLHYYSSYNDSKYKIGKNRFVVFKGNDSIDSDFSNINNLKLNQFSFNEDAIIKDFKFKSPFRGIVEETIFLDTLIKENNENKKIIRTFKLYVDSEKLLIDRIKDIK